MRLRPGLRASEGRRRCRHGPAVAPLLATSRSLFCLDVRAAVHMQAAPGAIARVSDSRDRNAREASARDEALAAPTRRGFPTLAMR